MEGGGRGPEVGEDVDDVFQWLINESSGRGIDDLLVGDAGFAGPLELAHQHQQLNHNHHQQSHHHHPLHQQEPQPSHPFQPHDGHQLPRAQHPHAGFAAHAQSTSAHYPAPRTAATSESFGWADNLISDSPQHAPANFNYPSVAPLADDLSGAFDIVMGGSQGSNPGVSSAMHEFATEAASGQRRRGFYGSAANAKPPGMYRNGSAPLGNHAGDHLGPTQWEQTQSYQDHTAVHRQGGHHVQHMQVGIMQDHSEQGMPSYGAGHYYENQSPAYDEQIPEYMSGHSSYEGGRASAGAGQPLQPYHHTGGLSSDDIPAFEEAGRQPQLFQDGAGQHALLPPEQNNQAQFPNSDPSSVGGRSGHDRAAHYPTDLLNFEMHEQQRLQPDAHAAGRNPNPAVPHLEQFDNGTAANGPADAMTFATAIPPTPGITAESGADPGRGRGRKRKGEEPMSPRALSQRERNREAVRNCRKRKREYAQKLKEREAMLEAENAKLRMQLKLGSEEMQNSMTLQCNGLAVQMKEQLQAGSAAPSKSDQGSVLASLSEHYLQTDTEQFRNREEATKHIISRLLRQIEPTSVTKMYLWQIAQDDSYFLSSSGLWQELKTRLGLTREQLRELRARRGHVLGMCREIASVLDRLDKLHELVLKRKRLSGENMLFRNVAAVLAPTQLAKFISFVHDFPTSGEMEGQWLKYLESFDKELDEEKLNKTGEWVVHNTGPRSVLEAKGEMAFGTGRSRSATTTASKPGTATDDIDDDLLRNRHKSAIVLKELFERSEEELMGFANAAFAPDLDLYDPNTVRVIHGIDKVLKYIRRIRVSFEGLLAKEESFMTRKNVARGRWTLTGTYYGFKLKHPVKGDADGEGGAAPPVPEMDMFPKKPEGKKVSFKVVIAYKFVPGSAQIQQLMVSWAALDVMRQLSLLPESFKETLGDKMKQEQALEKKNRAAAAAASAAVLRDEVKRREQEEEEEEERQRQLRIEAARLAALPPLPKLDQKLKETKCIELTKIFQVDTPAERLDIADDLLDDQCVFQDANMGGAFCGPDACIDYIRRLRRPFSTMEMTKHNFVSVNKRKRNAKNKSRRAGSSAPSEEPAVLSRTASSGANSNDPQSRIQMGCLVKGMYAGALVSTPKPYEFNATIFITFNHDNNKILEVEMSWNAASLMRQLGVLS